MVPTCWFVLIAGAFTAEGLTVFLLDWFVTSRTLLQTFELAIGVDTFVEMFYMFAVTGTRSVVLRTTTGATFFVAIDDTVTISFDITGRHTYYLK